VNNKYFYSLSLFFPLLTPHPNQHTTQQRIVRRQYDDRRERVGDRKRQRRDREKRERGRVKSKLTFGTRRV